MEEPEAGKVARRTFLGVAAAGAVHLAAGGSSVAQGNEGDAEAREEERPVSGCKYWMHGFGGDDPKKTAAAFKEAGFDVVVAGGAAVIDAVNAAGMEAWLCGGAFGLGSHKDDDSFKAKDLSGKPQIWFGSGCPNHPTLREENIKSYKGMAATDGVKGILVDGCRFASPASGLNPYFTCFCDTCKAKANTLGLDFDAMKRDVKALYDAVVNKQAGSRGALWLATPAGVLEWMAAHPGVVTWLQFRRMCATEHFRDVCKVIHDGGKRTGVYIFTPSVAPLVGQSYADLCEIMDVFAPMIYRNYPDRPGPACLNWELTAIPEELGLAESPAEATAMGLILAWASLADIVKERTIKEVQTALPPEAVGHQTALARALIGPDKELAPIIYIDDPLMSKTADLVRKSGANGVNFFVFKEDWPDMVRPGIS